MTTNQPTDEKTHADHAVDKPSTWLRLADGIYRHIPSGIYYERPSIEGTRTWRSLNSRNFDEAQKEYYRRRAKGDAAYQEAPMTKVGEVILNYKAGNCLDRFREQRPAARTERSRAL